MYATTTLQQATSTLAQRLLDPLMVRWSQPELIAYIREAIRTWNSLTAYFRDQGVFTTLPNQPFYDLPSKLSSLVGYTVTNLELVSVLEYQLLEPATPNAWTGSTQFNLVDLTVALQRRRDQFLLETGMVQTRSTQQMPVAWGGRQTLNQAVMTVRRAAWQTTDGAVTPLTREDVWAFNHWAPSWVQQPGRPPGTVPFGFSVGETPPLVFQVAPPPNDTGALDLISISRGPWLNTYAPDLQAAFLGIPDDWTWVVRYGAFADLLAKDGLAADPPRAAYCEQRWQQGIQIAKSASTVWAARINNQVIQLGGLSEADAYDGFWQARLGQPDTALLAGGNLIGLASVPDAVYSVTLDLVRNAIVPVALGDYLQVGEEILDVIFDYCEHLALTKEGINGVQDSMPQLERFFRLAGVTVSINLASTPNLQALTDQTRQDEAQTARMAGGA